MIVGIVSDLHRMLTDRTKEALRGCDRIICAGDCERPQLLWELQTIAPVIAVLGNCDRGSDFGASTPFTATPLLDGVRFKIVHRPQDAGTLSEETAVLVHGHTHVPRDEMRDGVRWICPGSASEPRSGSVASVVRMVIHAGSVESVEFISVES